MKFSTIIHAFLLPTSCLFPVLAALAAPVDSPNEPVGRSVGNRFLTPANQIVTPLGQQIELPGLRPQALALSPNGRILAVSGKTSEVLIINPATGAIRQRVALPAEAQNEPQPKVASANILQPDIKGQVSFTGMIFSHDGRWIFLSNVNGSIKVLAVDDDNVVTPSHSIALPLANAPRRKEEIPTGLTISADGKTLYVCANLSNQLLELEISTGKVLRKFEVGVAPYDVALIGNKAYVSNWGGRRPKPGELTGPAGRGTEVKVDRLVVALGEPREKRAAIQANHVDRQADLAQLIPQHRAAALEARVALAHEHRERRGTTRRVLNQTVPIPIDESNRRE